jgi:hypothetical protein
VISNEQEAEAKTHHTTIKTTRVIKPNNNDWKSRSRKNRMGSPKRSRSPRQKNWSRHSGCLLSITLEPHQQQQKHLLLVDRTRDAWTEKED